MRHDYITEERLAEVLESELSWAVGWVGAEVNYQESAGKILAALKPKMPFKKGDRVWHYSSSYRYGGRRCAVVVGFTKKWVRIRFSSYRWGSNKGTVPAHALKGRE